MTLLAFFFAVGAVGLLIAAVARVVKGAIGVAIVLFVLAVALGGAAGGFAAAA
ncbi:MAG TPA: hypothetical protein VFV00_02890 [Acidimicrobiales bacterium]|nr:hypothetical protein [Acidimicrobiales bacterium]